MTATTPLMNTYAQLPVSFGHGDGAWLFDLNGRRYLDCLSGIAVNTLGHNHPRLVAGLREQIGRVIHVSNLFTHPLRDQLARLLLERSGLQLARGCHFFTALDPQKRSQTNPVARAKLRQGGRVAAIVHQQARLPIQDQQHLTGNKIAVTERLADGKAARL